MSNVQIPERLFLDLVRYFYVDTWSEAEASALESAIKRGLGAKIEAMAARDLYTAYKTAKSPEEREKARQQYLDQRGIPASFRWSDDQLNNP